MRAGSGRAGDFAGDPLVLSAEYLKWLNAGKTSIRAAFSVFPKEGLPSFKWIIYKDGAVAGVDVLSPQDFATSAAVVPNIAAVAVSAESYTSDYDPLGSENEANVVTVLQKVLSPSGAVDADEEATKDQLWMLSYLFCINWSKGVQLTQAFETDIVKSFNETEQRWALVETPKRTLRATLFIRGKQNMKNARNLFARASKARWMVPLYCDEAQINGTPSGFSIPCNAKDKRFTAGMYIAVVKFDTEKRVVTQIQVTTCAGATDTTVDLNTAVDAGFGVGSYVYPIIEADLSLAGDMDVLSDELMEVVIEAQETFGNSSIYPFNETQTVPSGISQFLGKLILDCGYDYSGKMTVGWERTGEYTQMGRGRSLQVYGDRARWTYNLNYRQLSREESTRIVKFFEAVGGRLESFYVISPTSDLAATSISTGNIVVPKEGEELDWDAYTHIAVVLKTGEVIMKAITSVQRVGNNDIVNFSDFGATPTLAEVQRIAFAHLARFDTDAMEENWLRDTILETSLKVIEVFNEGEVEVADLADFSACEVTPPEPPAPEVPLTATEDFANRRHRIISDQPFGTPLTAASYNNSNYIDSVGKSSAEIAQSVIGRRRLIIPYILPSSVTAYINTYLYLKPKYKSTDLEPFKLNIYVVDGTSNSDFDLVSSDRLLASVDDVQFTVGVFTPILLDVSKLADYVGLTTLYLLFTTECEALTLGAGYSVGLASGLCRAGVNNGGVDGGSGGTNSYIQTKDI